VGADGTIYCANTGNETVTEYPKGETSPSLTVSLDGETPENLAVDAPTTSTFNISGAR
jgi:hypothetical protein